MSTELINRSPDLIRLQDEGYEVEVTHGFLVVSSIPYVNTRCEIISGTIVSELTLSNDITQRPGSHQVWFSGEHPCDQNGVAITALGDSGGVQKLFDGLEVQHHFSSKPRVGYYEDYYAKITQYVKIISNPARAIDPSVTACTFKPIVSTEEVSVFKYTDSASSRSGIANLSQKLAMDKIAFIGLGGTGAYSLDLVVKTHVRELHLFDGDKYYQHNAFRSPGAASIEDLGRQLSKVDYFAEMYGKMRRGIFTHEIYIDEDNVG